MKQIKQLIVEVGDISYPIFIGAGALRALKLHQSLLKNVTKLVIITSSGVAMHHLESLQRMLMPTIADVIEIPDGEDAKSLSVYQDIITQMLEKCCGRDTLVLAFGGGAVGDVAGFVCATYQRGIAYIQIPTTLLAQVDASVGGKTALNHPLGKNMIGAFYQPQAVLTDICFLQTLSAREFTAGLAEVIKTAVIADQDFFVWLEKHILALIAQDHQALAHAINRCCQIKAAIVAQDEKEKNVRAYLNFGHSFGHAIETAFGYDVYLHGEAVAIGMVLAAQCAVSQGIFTITDAQRLRALLVLAGLPVTPPASLCSKQFLDLMQKDKKNYAGKLHLVLPVKLGVVQVFDNIPSDIIIETIEMEKKIGSNDSCNLSKSKGTG